MTKKSILDYSKNKPIEKKIYSPSTELKSMLPITHKPFRYVRNLGRVGGNPGIPFRPL